MPQHPTEDGERLALGGADYRFVRAEQNGIEAAIPNGMDLRLDGPNSTERSRLIKAESLKRLNLQPDGSQLPRVRGKVLGEDDDRRRALTRIQADRPGASGNNDPNVPVHPVVRLDGCFNGLG